MSEPLTIRWRRFALRLRTAPRAAGQRGLALRVAQEPDWVGRVSSETLTRRSTVKRKGPSGVRYVIPKDVAAGSVQFGHTNVLTGPQWVQAFTEALQHAQPQWWDSQAKRFVSEKLVLVTNDARTVMVLPKSMAQEFQHRVAN